MSASLAQGAATRSYLDSGLRRNSSGTFDSGTSPTSADALRSGNSAHENLIIESLQKQLQSQAQQDPATFRAALHDAYGGKASPAELDRLLDLALAGKLPMPANVQFVEAGSLGGTAMGAYSTENGGTIYLDRRLLNQPARLSEVFTEEVGHHLDAQLGGTDAAGDEGAIFAQTLTGGSLSRVALASLKAENDHGTVWIDGREVQVEFYGSDYTAETDPNGGGGGGSTSGGDTGSGGGSESTGSGGGSETSGGAGGDSTGSGGESNGSGGAGDNGNGGREPGHSDSDNDRDAERNSRTDTSRPDTTPDTDLGGDNDEPDDDPGDTNTSGGDETTAAPPNTYPGDTDLDDENEDDEGDSEPSLTPEQARMAAERSGMPPVDIVDNAPPADDDDDDESTEDEPNPLSDDLLDDFRNYQTNCPNCHGTLPDPNAVTTEADRQFMRDLGLDMTIGMTGIGGLGLGAYRAFASPSPASIGGVFLDALPGPNVFRSVPNVSPATTTRPSWRQSEIDVSNNLGPSYDTQRSFINGVEVPYGTKGSVRPDNFRPGESVEVKNYNVETSAGRRSLERNVSQQIDQRATHLPDGTRQTVQVDVRGQNVSVNDLDDMIDNIVNNSNGNITHNDFNILR